MPVAEIPLVAVAGVENDDPRRVEAFASLHELAGGAALSDIQELRISPTEARWVAVCDDGRAVSFGYVTDYVEMGE
jgi:hypothetical protein